MTRPLDIAVSLAALPFAAAVSAPFAIAVWLQDRRSPLYAGLRVGKDRRPYRQLKLRSMVGGAAGSGVDATAAGDPRITPVGHFIRRHKLDELPQLWNVLAGEMSLVGPRPNCERECAMFSEEEERMLTIRPGITDIASIVFSDEQEILRGSADPDLAYHQLVRPYKSRFCLLYLERRSLRLDLELLGVTSLVLLSRPLGLRALERVLERIDAGEELISIARRSGALAPAAPPGFTAPVAEIPGRHAVA
jgi:lipopolysaccharide/colanic/teichoic acid biosynthesis glycosyltransferase